MKNILTAFPALAVPLALYALVALGASGAEGGVDAVMDGVVFSFGMPAGVWALSWGEVLVLFGLVALFIDLIKATGTGGSVVVNHGLSLGVFVLCLVLFLLAPPFVTSPFFLLMFMTLLDVIAGFIVTIISARRDVSFD